MIRNILYSLFLHLILFYLIYLNFNFEIKRELEDVSVSFISIDNIKTKTASIKPDSDNFDNKNTQKIEQKKIDKINEQNFVKDNSKKKSEKKIEAKSSKEAKKSSPNKEKLISQNTSKKSSTTPNSQAKIEEKETLKNENSNSEKDNKTEIEEEKITQNLGEEKEKKLNEEDQNNQENQDEDVSFMQSILPNQNQRNQAIENIALSFREKINIKSQFNLCYLKAISESGVKSKKRIMVKIYLDESGVITSDLDELLNNEKFNSIQFDDYRIGVKNIKRAIEICSPIKNLPADKYDIWKEIILEFGEED
jgi:hypothetical protein